MAPRASVCADRIAEVLDTEDLGGPAGRPGHRAPGARRAGAPRRGVHLPRRLVESRVGEGVLGEAGRLPCLRGKAARLSLQADGVHAARGVHRRGGAGAPAEDPRQPHHDGPQAHLRQLSRWHVATVRRIGPRLRAADDGREASHRDPQGSRRLTARSGRDRRRRDRARARQRDRLGLRARRPPVDAMSGSSSTSPSRARRSATRSWWASTAARSRSAR